ncbi:MAG TPA: GNAT family N-acetyltransferase [Rubrivivax sp.]|nr:GNAT family N-acetyltransferase [Rubrivivax sp.]
MRLGTASVAAQADQADHAIGTLPFSIREINSENVNALLKLELLAGQKGLVASVATSLAQVAYEPAGRAVAIYEGEEPAGMMLLYDARLDKKRPAPQLYLWRLLVDARFQRRGLGRQALLWVIEEAGRMGVESVGLSHRQADGHAGPFYQKMGFSYTGEVDDDEVKMVYKLA